MTFSHTEPIAIWPGEPRGSGSGGEGGGGRLPAQVPGSERWRPLHRYIHRRSPGRLAALEYWGEELSPELAERIINAPMSHLNHFHDTLC